MRGEAAKVRLLVEGQLGLRVVQVKLQNASTERIVYARWRVRVLRNQELGQVIAPPADGEEDYELFPGEARVAAIQVAPLRGIPGSALGPRVQAGEPEDAMFCVEFAYASDDGDRVKYPPVYYALGVSRCSTRRYQQRAVAERAWLDQGGHLLAPLEPPAS